MLRSLKVIVYGSSGLLVSLYLTGCGPTTVVPAQQYYEVNGAKVCDYQHFTPIIQDDCDHASAGYYYHPGSSMVFYRTGSGRTIVVERNVPRGNALVGGTLPLTKPVLTNHSGTPLLNNGGSVVRSPSTSRSGSSITTSPVRSTATFNAPGTSRVNAGKSTSGGGASRGMSFGSGSRGSSGG